MDYIKQTRYAIYCKSDIDSLSREHCRRRKAIIIKYSECVIVALVIQHEQRLRRIILLSVACPAPLNLHSTIFTLHYIYTPLYLHSTTFTLHYIYTPLYLHATTFTLHYIYTPLNLHSTTFKLNYIYTPLNLHSNTFTLHYIYTPLNLHSNTFTRH